MSLKHTQNEIPFYGLYGEPLSRSNQEFVHIENIADRSKGRDWLIKTHRHSKLFQIVCIEEGAVEVNLDGVVTQLNGKWAMSIPAGVAHGFKFQPDTQGSVLSLDTAILESSILAEKNKGLHILSSGPHTVKCLDEDQYMTQFLGYISLLTEEFRSYGENRNNALEWLSNLTLLNFSRHLNEKQVRQSGNAESQSLRKFWSLLEQHYREHWTVADYANNLHISTPTLNRLCRKCLGESPKTIIDYRLLVEAKRRLEYTQQSLEEIAFSLGFKDQAYFCRYFKKHMATTPGKFRLTRA